MIASQYLCLVLKSSIENCQSAFENKAMDTISTALSMLINASSAAPDEIVVQDETATDLRRIFNSELNDENSRAIQRTLLFLLLSLNSLSLKCSSVNKFIEHEPALLGVIIEFARLGVDVSFSTSSNAFSGGSLELCLGAWQTIITLSSKNDRVLDHFVRNGVFLYALYFVFFFQNRRVASPVSVVYDEENAEIERKEEQVIDVNSPPMSPDSSSRNELRVQAARFIGLMKEKNSKKYIQLINTFLKEYSSSIDNPSTLLAVAQSLPHERVQKLQIYLIEQIRAEEDDGEWKEFVNDRISFQY
jgi:hypothetical protein